MNLRQSGEDYLEAILILRQRKGSARSIDVAQYLGYSKPSVSRAMSILRQEGYIETLPSGELLLTESGARVAETMYERHRLFSDWLTQLGVPPETAANDACRLEHALSEESFSRIKKFIACLAEKKK